MSPGFNEKEEKSGGQLGNPELKCRTTLELTRISSLLLADMLVVRYSYRWWDESC